jgi:hypothetical protein
MKSLRNVLMIMIVLVLSFSECSIFQGPGSIVSDACFYAKDVCTAAEALCSVLSDTTASAAVVQEKLNTFRVQAQLVTAEANNHVNAAKARGK